MVPTGMVGPLPAVAGMIADVAAAHLKNRSTAPVRTASATHPAPRRGHAVHGVGHHVPARELVGGDPLGNDVPRWVVP